MIGTKTFKINPMFDLYVGNIFHNTVNLNGITNCQTKALLPSEKNEQDITGIVIYPSVC